MAATGNCKSEEALGQHGPGLATVKVYDYLCSRLCTADCALRAWPQLNPCGPSPLRTVSFGSTCTTLRQQHCTRHDRHCTSLSIVLKCLCRVALPSILSACFPSHPTSTVNLSCLPCSLAGEMSCIFPLTLEHAPLV